MQAADEVVVPGVAYGRRVSKAEAELQHPVHPAGDCLTADFGLSSQGGLFGRRKFKRTCHRECLHLRS